MSRRSPTSQTDGWIRFASLSLIIVGALSIIDGLISFIDDGYFVVRKSELLVVGSYKAWGTMHLVLGVLLLISGIAVGAGKTWGRAVATIVAIFERLPLRFRGTMLFLICILAPLTYLLTANRLHVFDIQRSERRYISVGEHIGGTLPPNAVVLTVIQSGSVRLYGHRPTLRWDLLTPERLDQTLDGLRQAGYVPYLLLESWEEDLFRSRFATTSIVGNIDWQPVLEYYGPISVRVFRPDDREPYFSGRRVLPRAVPYP